MNESGSGMRGWNAAMTRLRPIIAVAAAETGCCTMAGTMTATPDFRLYHGNALEVLAELLAETLRISFGTKAVGWDNLVYGVLLVMFIIFLPKGILGSLLEARWLQRRPRQPAPAE